MVVMRSSGGMRSRIAFRASSAAYRVLEIMYCRIASGKRTWGQLIFSSVMLTTRAATIRRGGFEEQEARRISSSSVTGSY